MAASWFDLYSLANLALYAGVDVQTTAAMGVVSVELSGACCGSKIGGVEVEEIFTGVFINLLSEFVVVVLGVLFAQYIRSRLDRRRFGGWQVIVKQLGKAVDVRPVSPGKIKQIHEIPEELSVFLKGVASGYGWINCDLVTDGRELGMLTEDRFNRTYTIDMDRNPVKRNEQIDEPHLAAPASTPQQPT